MYCGRTYHANPLTQHMQNDLYIDIMQRISKYFQPKLSKLITSFKHKDNATIRKHSRQKSFDAKRSRSMERYMQQQTYPQQVVPADNIQQSLPIQLNEQIIQQPSQQSLPTSHVRKRLTKQQKQQFNEQLKRKRQAQMQQQRIDDQIYYRNHQRHRLLQEEALQKQRLQKKKEDEQKIKLQKERANQDKKRSLHEALKAEYPLKISFNRFNKQSANQLNNQYAKRLRAQHHLELKQQIRRQALKMLKQQQQQRERIKNEYMRMWENAHTSKVESTIKVNFKDNGQTAYIGQVQTNTDGQNYYTTKYVTMPLSHLRYILQYYDTLKALRQGRIIFPGGQNIMIKDIYKGITYYGIRKLAYFNGKAFPTRNGFNLTSQQMKLFIDSIHI